MLKSIIGNTNITFLLLKFYRRRGYPTRTGGLYVPNVARYQLRQAPKN